MECGIVSDVAFWQVLWCEHIIILFWYVRNVRTGREERIGKEKFEMRCRLAKAVELYEEKNEQERGLKSGQSLGGVQSALDD